jgi:hypothetical protein
MIAAIARAVSITSGPSSETRSSGIRIWGPLDGQRGGRDPVRTQDGSSNAPDARDSLALVDAEPALPGRFKVAADSAVR